MSACTLFVRILTNHYQPDANAQGFGLNYSQLSHPASEIHPITFPSLKVPQEVSGRLLLSRLIPSLETPFVFSLARKSAPEGLNPFAFPDRHQKKTRTSNSIEGTVQQ